MKKLLLTTLTGLSLLGLTGCSKSTSSASSGPDTTRVESAFATVSAVDKAEVERAIAAIKSADYTTAAATLKQAATNVRLTPEQQQALHDLAAQVQAKLAQAVDQAKAAGEDAAKKMTEAADKAAGDLKKAVGK